MSVSKKDIARWQREQSAARARIETLTSEAALKDAVIDAADKVHKRYVLTEGGYGAIDVLQTGELGAALLGAALAAVPRRQTVPDTRSKVVRTTDH